MSWVIIRYKEFRRAAGTSAKHYSIRGSSLIGLQYRLESIRALAMITLRGQDALKVIRSFASGLLIVLIVTAETMKPWSSGTFPYRSRKVGVESRA